MHTRKTRSKYESSVPRSTPGDSPTGGASPIRAPHHVWQAHTIRFRKEALGRDLSAKGWTPGLRDSGPGLLEKNLPDSVIELYVGFSKMGYPQVLDHFSIETC